MNKIKDTREILDHLINGKTMEDLVVPSHFIKKTDSKEVRTIKTKTTQTINKSKLLKHLIQVYQDDLTKRCTPSTVKTTIKKLNTFRRYCLTCNKRSSISIKTITEDNIVNFLYTRNRVNANTNYKSNVYYSVLRKFYNFINIHGHNKNTFETASKLLSNVGNNVDKISMERKKHNPLVLSEVEIEETLNYLSTKYNSQRNMLAVLLLLQVPISKKTLMNLQRKNFSDDYVTYIHKNKSIKAKLGKRTISLINEMHKSENELMFSNREISLNFDSTIRKSFLFIKKHLGININYTTLQNTLIIRLYENNNSIKTISRYLKIQYDYIYNIINKCNREINENPY